MRTRDIGRYLRARKEVTNPRELLAANSADHRGELRRIVLRRWGSVAIRAGTADVRILKEIFLKDVYGLAAFEGRTAAPQLDCVVDIGGHIGLFAVRASRIAKRVISFEPNPSNLELFRRNALTTESGNLELSDLALSSAAGPLEIFASSNPGGHSILASLAGSDSSKWIATGVSLEEAFEKYGVRECDFLKVDCEGAEYPILFGASASTLARIRRIALEYHAADSVNPEFTGQALEDFLSYQGFETERVPSRRRGNHGLIRAHRGGERSRP